MIAVLAEPRAGRGRLDLPHGLLERSCGVGGARRSVDDPRGEEVRRDPLARLGAEDNPVYLVLELAHVARPRVALEEAERVRIEPAELFPLLLPEAVEKMEGEET